MTRIIYLLLLFLLSNASMAAGITIVVHTVYSYDEANVESAPFDLYVIEDDGSERVYPCLSCLTGEDGKATIQIDSEINKIRIVFDADVFPVIMPDPAGTIDLSTAGYREGPNGRIYIIPCIVLRAASSVYEELGVNFVTGMATFEGGWSIPPFNDQSKNWIRAIVGTYPTSGKVLIAQAMINEGVDMDWLSSAEKELVTSYASADYSLVKSFETLMEDNLGIALETDKPAGYAKMAGIFSETSRATGLSTELLGDLYVGASMRSAINNGDIRLESPGNAETRFVPGEDVGNTVAAVFTALTDAGIREAMGPEYADSLKMAIQHNLAGDNSAFGRILEKRSGFLQ